MYWSSTTTADSSSTAWFVNFFDGFVDGVGKVLDVVFARAVRGSCGTYSG